MVVRPGTNGEGRLDPGDGMRLGLTERMMAVPDKATVVESTKPGDVRSSRYHMAGFERASVSESCSVDCHGSFR